MVSRTSQLSDGLVRGMNRRGEAWACMGRGVKALRCSSRSRGVSAGVHAGVEAWRGLAGAEGSHGHVGGEASMRACVDMMVARAGESRGIDKGATTACGQ
ncbi:hypothetical protein GUJ93_ZPchr0001g31697 [Zizania palustris]|uniref:Uncharacterized protein n=1 Tax=Zizania palustris TaxID=103762 RepID=A0A8J5V7J2_ZIZPA|nr:hypothetical protein GUJ93_ZPchr0001g31697 [Zizania palustris]